LLSRLGPNVNLGNIQPVDVLALEALRVGLRSDTLKLCLSPDSTPIHREIALVDVVLSR